MPGMNGADVAKAISADPRFSRVPVVMLTSVDQVDFGRLVLDYGIAAYLTKPARSAVLLGTLVSAIQKSRQEEGRATFVRRAAPAALRPALVAPATDGAPSAAREALASTAPLDILIAEDNEVNQLVFSQILGELGLSHRIAANGRTAVELHRTLKPKLILMDVSMPEMNGFEATKAIRAAETAAGRHTPIIGVTAHALKGDREKCIEAGMDDYLSKPISPNRLNAKIRTWLGEGSSVAETARSA
jgi:CheY-like chemotaxis protein